MIHHTGRLIFEVTVILLFFTSCDKTIITEAPITKSVETPAALNFKDILSASSFDWRLTRMVKLIVLGTPSSAIVVKSLKVSSIDGSEVFLTVLLDAENDYSFNMLISSQSLKVKITFGSLVKTVDIVGKTVSFDYSNNFLIN